MNAKTSLQPKLSPSSHKGDKIEVIKVLALMVVSFLLGFALVILFLRPTPPSTPNGDVQPPKDPQPAHAGRQNVETANDRYAPPDPLGGKPTAGNSPDETKSNTYHEGTAPREVPPGRTPEGVTSDGAAFYLKCWDQDGNEHPSTSCDRLRILEKRFSTRLYVVDKCKIRHAGAKAEGKLSLGIEIDFNKMSLRFWNGASSDLDSADKVATCLRSELNGLPISGISHKHARYRIFFTILFAKTTKKEQLNRSSADRPKPVGGKGRLVEVVQDRVRVRKSPKDGAIIGKISSGNQVRLIETQAGWCRVTTPNNNEGWMICDALKK